MAQTTNWNLTLLEIGQKSKESTINQNMTELSNRIPRFLGSFTADPNAAGVPLGSTYYNSSVGQVSMLISVTPSATWHILG